MILILILLLAMVPTGYAQVQDHPAVVINSFGGLNSAEPTDVQTIGADVVNFDFRTSGGQGDGEVSLIMRHGFDRHGQPLNGATGGVYSFRRADVGRQMLGAFDTLLYIYNPNTFLWELVNESILSDTCNCANGETLVSTVYKKRWWPLSIENYTQININGTNYDINKMVGDSVIITETGFAGSTGRYPCALVGSGVGSGSNVFDQSLTTKRAIQYGDSLWIFTEDEIVCYNGNSNAALAQNDIYNSMSEWELKAGGPQITLYGADPYISSGSGWFQIYPKTSFLYSNKYNTAFKSLANTTNSLTFLVDSGSLGQWWNIFFDGKLYNDTIISYKEIPAVTWTNLFTAENINSSSIIDSLFSELKGYPYDGYAFTQTVTCSVRAYQNCPAAGSSQKYAARYQRQITPKKKVYLYRWEVLSVGASAWPNGGSPWPDDSLRWMTVTALNASGTDGLLEGVFPVDVQDNGGALYFDIATYGASSEVTVYDSTVWTRMSGGIPSLQNCGGVTNTSTGFPLTVTNYRNGFLVFDNCATMSSTFDCPVCSAAVCYINPDPSDYGDWNIGVVPPADGANTAFQVGNDLTLRRMNKQSVTALATSTRIGDTSWHYPICVELMDRFWCTGNPEFPNRIIASEHTDVDSVSTTFLEIFARDGAPNTALAAEGNILVAHKPTGIWNVPINTADLEPEEAEPSASVYGALSQEGLAVTPYGHYFVAFDGVRIYNGSTSDMFSGALASYWRDSINLARLSEATLAYDPTDRRLILSVARGGGNINDMTFFYDFVSGLWGKHTYGARDFEVLTYPSDEPQLYWTDPDLTRGGVYHYDRELQFDTGAYIDAYWQTGWLPLADRIGEKVDLWDWYIEGRRNTDSRIYLQTFVNGDSTAVHGDTLALPSARIWDVEHAQFPSGIVGRRFSFRLGTYQATSGRITGLRIDYEPRGMQ